MQKQKRMQRNKSNCHAKRTTANYRHTESLNYFYFVGQGLTADTHAQKPSEKEKKIKGLPFLSSRQARVRAVIVARKWRSLLWLPRTHRRRTSLSSLLVQPCAVPLKPILQAASSRPRSASTRAFSIVLWPSATRATRGTSSQLRSHTQCHVRLSSTCTSL